MHYHCAIILQLRHRRSSLVLVIALQLAITEIPRENCLCGVSLRCLGNLTKRDAHSPLVPVPGFSNTRKLAAYWKPHHSNRDRPRKLGPSPCIMACLWAGNSDPRAQLPSTPIKSFLPSPVREMEGWHRTPKIYPSTVCVCTLVNSPVFPIAFISLPHLSLFTMAIPASQHAFSLHSTNLDPGDPLRSEWRHKLGDY